MRKFFRVFIDRYFHDEEAVIFTLILLASLLVLLTIGSFIAPLIVALIVAYLLQGMVNTLLRLGVSYLLAVVIVYTFFVSAFMTTLLLVLPQAWAQLTRLINELPRLISEGQALMMVLPENYPSLISEQQIQEFIRSLRGELAMAGQYLLSYSISSLPNIFSWVIFIILVPVLVFFMMKDKTKLVEWVANLLPRHRGNGSAGGQLCARQITGDSDCRWCQLYCLYRDGHELHTLACRADGVVGDHSVHRRGRSDFSGAGSGLCAMGFWQ